MHTELDTFSLPYWNYTARKKPENRKFPREFGIEHLDGDLNNNKPENINPLYHPERDFYFCGYEHPFAKGLPLLAGGIADEDPSTRGLLESYPHDQIHRSVGGIITKIVNGQPVQTVGAMATPPTAAFDPIFPIHHSNIDRLWAVWSCKAGKKWGQLPSMYWFDERAWYFFDTDGKVVNRPRKDYFDYRALGIRFKGEDENCKPLTLPNVEKKTIEAVAQRVRATQLLAQHKAPVGALPALRAIVPIPAKLTEQLQKPVKTMRAAKPDEQRMVLRLMDVSLGLVQGTGFDVHLTDRPKGPFQRSDPSFAGSISMFRHEALPGHKADAHGGTSRGRSESFDVTRAIAAVKNDKLEGLSLVLVPYSLLTVQDKRTTILNNRETLKAAGMEFLRMDLK
jgi:hypothetical protein